MQPFSVRAKREAEAWAAVAEVNDPELDEPVTEMGFVERIEVDEQGAVELDFRLPTYWCSPNFAFLMLDGVRAAIEALPWRPPHRIRLHDHLFADEVNLGLDAGRSFEQIFEDLTPGENLDALREKFRMKAFEKRQEAVLAALREAGWTAAEIVALDLRALGSSPPGFEMAFGRYAEAFAVRFPAASSAARVIVDASGMSVHAADLSQHVARLRAVRINMEFNGALCRGLKDVRYREKGEDGELTVVDFLPRAPAVCATAV